MTILFNKEVWDKNVTLYDLVDHETKKVIESKYILREDAALLNRFYVSQGRKEDWLEAGWQKDSRKSSKKQKRT